MFFVFVPRHQVVKLTLREARRCGQSSVARRRYAERSELLNPLAVATWWLWGLVAGLFVVLFCKETRREHPASQSVERVMLM